MWRLPARPLADLLADLHMLAERVRHGETVDIPSLTLWLADGHRVDGQLVHFASREGLILIKAASTFDATYVALVQIRAVTVHYSESNLDALSLGAPAVDELHRRLEATLDMMGVQGELTMEGLPEVEAARRVLAQGLKDLDAVLRQIVANPEQRESFTQAFREVQVRFSPDGPAAVRSGPVLLVEFGVDAGQVTALSAGRLKAAVEKLL